MMTVVTGLSLATLVDITQLGRILIIIITASFPESLGQYIGPYPLVPGRQSVLVTKSQIGLVLFMSRSPGKSY
jgi:hypothetical protein